MYRVTAKRNCIQIKNNVSILIVFPPTECSQKQTWAYTCVCDVLYFISLLGVECFDLNRLTNFVCKSKVMMKKHAVLTVLSAYLFHSQEHSSMKRVSFSQRLLIDHASFHPPCAVHMSQLRREQPSQFISLYGFSVNEICSMISPWGTRAIVEQVYRPSQHLQS